MCVCIQDQYRFKAELKIQWKQQDNPTTIVADDLKIPLINKPNSMHMIWQASLRPLPLLHNSSDAEVRVWVRDYCSSNPT